MDQSDESIDRFDQSEFRIILGGPGEPLVTNAGAGGAPGDPGSLGVPSPGVEVGSEEASDVGHGVGPGLVAQLAVLRTCYQITCNV